MNITTHKNYLYIQDNGNDIQSFAAQLENKIPKEYATQNIVVDLTSFNPLTLNDLLLFIKTSTIQRANKNSFVMINKGIDPDIIPDELVVVPTLQEAEDVIEIEEIERDLDF